MSSCLSVCLSVCLPACLSACLSLCLPAFLPVCLSVCLLTPIHHVDAGYCVICECDASYILYTGANLLSKVVHMYIVQRIFVTGKSVIQPAQYSVSAREKMLPIRQIVRTNISHLVKNTNVVKFHIALIRIPHIDKIPPLSLGTSSSHFR